MKQASTREMIGYLKRIMRELGVKQLVLVDYDSPGLMLHTNRADFKPSRDNAVRSFPGPFMEVDDREPVTGWPECPTINSSDCED
jgi:hypothetical protein